MLGLNEEEHACLSLRNRRCWRPRLANFVPGATLKASNAAAAVPTTGVVPPAADEVSLLLATQFRTHAATYQTASAKAAVIHEQFVTTLATSASSYADTEAANAVVTG